MEKQEEKCHCPEASTFEKCLYIFIISLLLLVFAFEVNVRFNLLPPPADAWAKNVHNKFWKWCSGKN